MADTGTQPPADPVEQARALVAAGHYRQAVDLLSAQPAEALDLQTLCDLMVWRNAAFDPEAGQVSWPHRFADPFPETFGPPEIQVDALNVGILGGAIQHHGALIVRGLISPQETRYLEQLVRSAFGSAAAAGSDGQASPWFAPFPLKPGDPMSAGGRQFVTSNGAIWTGDSPRAFAEFTALLKAHGVTRIIEDYLGERVFLSLAKSVLRMVQPTPAGGWHQDGRFLGPGIRTVNVWLALSDCGQDAPGLDIHPRRLEGLVETGTKGAMLDWIVGDGVIEDLSQTAPVMTPVFKAGDAMLFDQLFLHQTAVRPEMTRERLAIESWFFAGSTFPKTQMPLAI